MPAAPVSVAQLFLVPSLIMPFFCRLCLSLISLSGFCCLCLPLPKPCRSCPLPSGFFRPCPPLSGFCCLSPSLCVWTCVAPVPHCPGSSRRCPSLSVMAGRPSPDGGGGGAEAGQAKWMVIGGGGSQLADDCDAAGVKRDRRRRQRRICCTDPAGPTAA